MWPFSSRERPPPRPRRVAMTFGRSSTTGRRTTSTPRSPSHPARNRAASVSRPGAWQWLGILTRSPARSKTSPRSNDDSRLPNSLPCRIFPARDDPRFFPPEISASSLNRGEQGSAVSARDPRRPDSASWASGWTVAAANSGCAGRGGANGSCLGRHAAHVTDVGEEPWGPGEGPKATGCRKRLPSSFPLQGSAGRHRRKARSSSTGLRLGGHGGTPGRVQGLLHDPVQLAPPG